jgi:membrane associated rhomboid family serine protease
MFPIGDDNSDSTITPYVNYAFIAINILVFVFLQGIGSNDVFSYRFSLVPREITTGIDLIGVQIVRDSLGNVGEVAHYATPLPVYFNFLSSMFMHGSFAHIFGNMLFLWVFGDNLENMLGHIRFAAFYIATGIAAAAAQIVMDTDSVIPMLGASGAISGVLGGYLVLFPRRRVRALIFYFLTEVPAFIAVGIWIVYQVVAGYMTPAGTGGVAYAAHIGGFVAGLILINVFAIGKMHPIVKTRSF